MRIAIRSSCLAKSSMFSSSRTTSPQLTALRNLHPPRSASPVSKHIPHPLAVQQQPWLPATFIRHKTDLNAPSPSSPSSPSHTTRPLASSPTPRTPNSSPSPSATHPAYEIYFTCKPCSHRSGPHRVTKQGFHNGTTLITCPSCQNRHVITDNLRIFTDEGGDLEDIMRRHGGKLKKGKLGTKDGGLVGNEGQQEEIEFWEDGTETPRLSQGSKGPS